MDFKGNSAQQISEQEQHHVTAKQNMADAQKLKKKKQKPDKNKKDVHFQVEDKIWIEVHSQNSAEKDFMATQRFVTKLFN